MISIPSTDNLNPLQLQAAKARGRVGGRPPALTADQKDEVRRMRDDEQRHVSEIARLFKVSERTVRRA